MFSSLCKREGLSLLSPFPVFLLDLTSKFTGGNLILRQCFLSPSISVFPRCLSLHSVLTSADTFKRLILRCQIQQEVLLRNLAAVRDELGWDVLGESRARKTNCSSEVHTCVKEHGAGDRDLTARVRV